MGDYKKTCCIFNLGPHYNFPLYEKMGMQLGCDFYLGDHIDQVIKTFDYHQLTGFKSILHNHFFHHFYWQSGAIKLLFRDYDSYILIGEPYCLSHWCILLLSKITKKEIIGWTHGWYGREGFIKNIIKKRFFKLFDKLLVYNEYAIGLMEKEGFNKNDMACIANSMDSDQNKAIREKLQSSPIYKDHFGNDNPVLLYCGRIQKWKRLDMLIDSVEMLHKEGIMVNLVIVGKDNENTGIEDYAAQKGLLSHIWFYGPCYDNQTLGNLFYNANICVSPGNVGLTAVHALSFGCPVITHNDLPYQGPEFEAIKSGVTGDFFLRNDTEDLVRTIKKWLQTHWNDREVIRQQAYDEVDRKWNIHYQIEVLKKTLT